MTQSITYTTAGKDPGRVLASMLPLAAVSTHLFRTDLGVFYHSIAGAIPHENYALQITNVGEVDKAFTGFAVWGMFNQVVAARFRCQPESLNVGDFASGNLPVLIMMAAPLSKAHTNHFIDELARRFPAMHLPEKLK